MDETFTDPPEIKYEVEENMITLGQAWASLGKFWQTFDVALGLFMV